MAALHMITLRIFQKLKQIVYLCRSAADLNEPAVDLNEYDLFQFFRNISYVIIIIIMQKTTLFGCIYPTQ
ncbi:hypothetical protein P8452_48272 [Trifolium repens]|nr:hypothetical protein P8452_48272 [Trifolium repens]